MKRGSAIDVEAATMLIGGIIIIGPLAGWVIKKFDELVEKLKDSQIKMIS